MFFLSTQQFPTFLLHSCSISTVIHLWGTISTLLHVWGFIFVAIAVLSILPLFPPLAVSWGLFFVPSHFFFYFIKAHYVLSNALILCRHSCSGFAFKWHVFHCFQNMFCTAIIIPYFMVPSLRSQVFIGLKMYIF